MALPVRVLIVDDACTKNSHRKYRIYLTLKLKMAGITKSTGISFTFYIIFFKGQFVSKYSLTSCLGSILVMLLTDIL